jgi:hypothetical protein
MKMKTSPRERYEFERICQEESIPLDVARKLMRAESTLHRLAEAQCNGDYPADNGERKVKQCPKCEQCWVPSFFTTKGICRECSLTDHVTKLCAPLNIKPSFGGDPRGALLIIKIPSGRTNDWGREGIVVP